MAAASFANMSLDSDYVMVAAIDFGTTFSGYAFSFKSDKNKIFMNKSWGQNMGFMAYKTPTCLMVNAAYNFVAFGYEAENRYAGIQDTDSDDEDNQEEYHLFRHFKMMLHVDERITKTKQLLALDGDNLSAVQVFSMALKYLKDHLLDAVSQTLEGSLDATQIRWVITVPAIWREEAKQFMREAAFNAGIICNKDSDQLFIALEPEAASVFCRSLELNHFIGESGKDAKTKFKTGTKYLVIDAGGGTVDLTAHEVLVTGKVKEIHTASGGAWGGTKVDDNFIKLLEEVLGRNFITEFQKHCPQQWLLFMVTFERVKRAIQAVGKSKINLQIPMVMATKYQEICAKSLETAIKEKAKPGVSFSDGLLLIKHDVVLQLFNPVIDNILVHVEKLLTEPEMKKLQYFLLVGGFAESALLQKAIKDEFSSQVKVLVPEEAQMSVIKGAVLFGHNPDDIQVRKARFTYGLGHMHNFSTNIHDDKYKISRDGKELCDKVFDIFVLKGTNIKLGEVVKRTYGPISDNQPTMEVQIYQSDRSQVKYTDEEGCKMLGTLVIEMPNLEKEIGREVEVEMSFGGTEIQVRAHDVESGTKAETVVDLLGGLIDDKNISFV